MDKILSLKTLDKVIKKVKDKGEKIILVGGCFDILHIGHIEFLEKSKNLGGKLIILLESDYSVEKLKGINHPVNKQEDRAIILSKLQMVDHVVCLPRLKGNNFYLTLVEKIKPDIISVTKGDPKKEQKMNQAKAVNSRLVEVMDRKKEYSSSEILKRSKS